MLLCHLRKKLRCHYQVMMSQLPIVLKDLKNYSWRSAVSSKRSTSIGHISIKPLKASGCNRQSILMWDSLSAMAFKTPGKRSTSNEIFLALHQRAILMASWFNAWDRVPPTLLIYETAVELSKRSLIVQLLFPFALELLLDVLRTGTFRAWTRWAKAATSHLN